MFCNTSLLQTFLFVFHFYNSLLADYRFTCMTEHVKDVVTLRMEKTSIPFLKHHDFYFSKDIISFLIYKIFHRQKSIGHDFSLFKNYSENHSFKILIAEPFSIIEIRSSFKFWVIYIKLIYVHITTWTVNSRYLMLDTLICLKLQIEIIICIDPIQIFFKYRVASKLRQKCNDLFVQTRCDTMCNYVTFIRVRLLK